MDGRVKPGHDKRRRLRFLQAGDHIFNKKWPLMPQMPPRQEAFRADYRPRISPYYLGWMHVALIFSLGGSAIWVCARQISAPAWYEWLVVPLAFCLSNVFEW